MKLEITRIQRQILHNQNLILSKLDPDLEQEYLNNAEIFERGIEGEYFSALNVYPDDQTITYEACTQTIDILNMFRVIENALYELDDDQKQTLDLRTLTFSGFDMNEASHYQYMMFMIEKEGKWDELRGKSLNSHTASSVPRYLELYRRFRDVVPTGGVKYQPTYEDLLQIAPKTI
jgi:uncharacterized protein YfbU (UPF0304 family)